MADDQVEQEIEALGVVYRALHKLSNDAQERVLGYVTHKLRGTAPAREETKGSEHQIDHSPEKEDDGTSQDHRLPDGGDDAGELDGISPVARKWMLRNGFTAAKLSAIFSLGADEIDVIAKNVPGDNTKERMRSVFLLEGIAAYLSTGASRFEHEKLRNACIHYKAFDTKNFAAYLKSMNSEISGSSKAGYALTTRGMTSAADLLKEIK